MSPLDIIALPGHPGMFARRVAVQAWQSAGSPPVNSAGRLYAEQKRLYDGWRLRKPGFQPADNPDNESLPLAHVRFVAFDIDPTADRIRRLTAAGFHRPYTYEPWHWELPNVRSYALVRSIPATASLDPERIIEKEDDTMLRFITRDGTGVWYATDGLTKRALGPGENQLLVDLGLAVYEAGGKPKLLGAKLDLIPDAVRVVGPDPAAIAAALAPLLPQPVAEATLLTAIVPAIAKAVNDDAAKRLTA